MCLQDYLETKRSAFPRFYFLSDDELLEIIAQTRDPTAVQRHLPKCFENINALTFGEDNIITAMSSAEGEVVPFVERFYPMVRRGPLFLGVVVVVVVVVEWDLLACGRVACFQ